MYSLEELIAEMGAAFLCAEAGISPAVIENQAAYIQGWLGKWRARHFFSNQQQQIAATVRAVLAQPVHSRAAATLLHIICCW